MRLEEGNVSVTYSGDKRTPDLDVDVEVSTATTNLHPPDAYRGTFKLDRVIGVLDEECLARTVTADDVAAVRWFVSAMKENLGRVINFRA